jgi:hypothetical protein
MKGGFRMKFSDIFLPKISRSDPKVRMQAVMKTRDKGLLKQVVEKDPDKQVQQTAKKRLEELSA